MTQLTAVQNLTSSPSMGSPSFPVERSNPSQHAVSVVSPSPSPVAVLNPAQYGMLGNHGRTVASVLEHLRSTALLESSLQQERVSLIATNIVLKSQVVESTALLEKEWLARVEQLSTVVHLLFIKLQLFDQEMGLEHKEALRVHDLHMSCAIDGNTWNYNLLHAKFGWNYFPVGAADATRFIYGIYSQHLGRYLPSIEKLHLTFRASCQAAITKTIQEIKKEKPLPPQPIENGNGEQENGSSALSLFPINEDLVVFQMYGQNQMAIVEMLRNGNQQIEEANKGLNKRKLEIKNLDSKFLQIVQNGLAPFSKCSFRASTKCLMNQTEFKDHPKYFSELTPSQQTTSRPAGTYKKEMELAKKISKAVSEMEVLIQKIEKGAPMMAKEEGALRL